MIAALARVGRDLAIALRAAVAPRCRAVAADTSGEYVTWMRCTLSRGHVGPHRDDVTGWAWWE